MENLENNKEETVVKTMSSGRKVAWAIVALAVVVVSFRSGYYFGNQGFVFEPSEFKIVNQKDSPGIVDYSLLWKTIDVLNEKYIEKPVDPQKTLYGAIKGAVAASGDQYTEFFEPKDLESFKTELKGSFDGIGAEIGKRNNAIVIVAPLPDTPAAKAGLLAKDFIVQVNGQPTTDWTVEKTVNEIRGERGTEVTLMIFREGKTEPFEVKIKRDEIKVKSVKVEYKTVQDKQIAVLTLSRFGDDTEVAFDQAIKEITGKNVAGMIVDLRNNPGGYLDTAVHTASYWVPNGQLVVTERHSEKEETPFNSRGLKKLEGMKTVVLINGGSASASEILAGALQDHKLAKLIGEKSFGKGSVQELVDLPGKSALKVTVAKWITPGGKHLNKDGLVPDIEVKRTEEDINADKDPQLDRALEEVFK